MVIADGRGSVLMACGCGKNKRRLVKDPRDVMGGYKYLKPNQIKARLEVFKKNNCKDCNDRYECNYERFLTCKGSKPKIV
jgi:hypothetical protein